MSRLEIRRSLFDSSRISIIAIGRRRRPKHYSYQGLHVGALTKTCPFCPGHEYMTPPATLVLTSSLEYLVEGEGERVRDWLVRIFPNKYPALLLNTEGSRGTISLYGYHEVIVESPIHSEEVYLENPKYMYYVFLALRRRIKEILGDDRIENVVVIKNRGPRAGASIVHPHLQLFANTFTPPVILSELQGFKKFKEKHGICPLCYMVNRIDEPRLVLESKHFIVYTRYAPKQAYELLIVPRKHSPCITSASDDELFDLAQVLSKVLKALLRLLGGVDYNYWIHCAPKNSETEYHWHIEIQPVVETWGGYEKSSGVHIVTVSPEESAAELRNILKSL